MGFDIECIVNIQTYPGEYFCPVCRTLVYPNEAFQSQCTHLYCKPCLAHVANTTKACPYDGYLVTEADAKPLIESDKALAENIGKVKVHCLYHRSGCTWEGTLSESSSHCSGCTFGNSSVICNRCGIQIVHRQVHDHAQTCPGAYQAPQAVDANQNAASSAVTASTTYVDQNHAVPLSGPSISQAQISQTSAAPLPSGHGPTQQANAGSQGASVAPSATPTPDQWYQQKYYQQYAGYNPYQQSYQQYYQYPQPVGQTYQQGQYNSQAYVQPQPQAQAQFQSYPVHQGPAQPHLQSLSQEKVTQTPVAVTGTNQQQSHIQSTGPHYQQVNSQQQFSSQQPHPQGNVTSHSQPQPHQVPGYQQPVQSIHPAIPSQNNTQSSQPQNMLQPQIQPQHQLHHQSLQYSQQYPPQISQPFVPNTQPHASHPANAVVTGHQSYKPPQQIPMAPSLQHAVPSHVVTGSLPVHRHILQQHPSARPPLSHDLVANQQKSAVPIHMPNNHPTQLQQLHPQAHSPASLVQHHPGMQSIQQSMPQQSQAFHALLQGQYSQFEQQQPLQSQLHPHGAPHVMQPGAHGYNSTQKNTPLVPGFIPQQPQNYGARPPMPAGGGFGPTAQNKPVPFGSSHSSAYINFVKREKDDFEHLKSRKDTNMRTDLVDLKAGNSGTQMKMEKEPIEETRDGSGLNRMHLNDADNELKKGGASEPVMLQPVKDERSEDSSDTHPAVKLLGVSAVKEHVDTGSHKELESLSNKKEPFPANRDSQSTNISVSSANGSNKLADPLKSQSLHSSGLHPQAPGFSPTSLKGWRPDHYPHHAPISGFPGPGSMASHGRGRGSFGHPPRSFGLHSGAKTPSMPGLPPDSVDPRSEAIGPLGHGPTGMDSSAFGLQDDRFNSRAGGHVNPFSMEPVRPFDQAGQPRFMPAPLHPGIVPEREPQYGVHDGFGQKADPSHAADFLMHNPGYGRNHDVPPHDREYLGMPPREPLAFGEGPRPFNLPPDSVDGSFHENIFPGMPSNMHRIERGGHCHNHLRSDPFEEEFSVLSRRGHISGPQNFPGHFRSGDAARFGTLPGGGRMGDMAGVFPHHLPGPESFRGIFPDFPRPGEHGVRSNYSRQGLADERFYADHLGPFEKSRKRKPVSMGWCRICKIDCESVEGLDMHSQTREHQRMALDMVKTIKQQNKKKSKMSGDRSSTMEVNKTRNSGFEG
ncbi:hypothetical protein Leryth_024985 [Lithospermum erythrorhizon]|nr:hypothetical protein Leryth_024985 [Lithospermum erythrorhizon]